MNPLRILSAEETRIVYSAQSLTPARINILNAAVICADRQQLSTAAGKAYSTVSNALTVIYEHFKVSCFTELLLLFNNNKELYQKYIHEQVANQLALFDAKAIHAVQLENQKVKKCEKSKRRKLKRLYRI